VSIPPFDALEAGLRIGRALEREGIAYALGGALALGVHGVPRGTLDVDINVFTSDGDLPKVIGVLTALGVDVDAAQASAQAARDGAFMGNWQGMRIDVFLPSIPFSAEAERTRVALSGGADGVDWFLSAETLAVFKLLFARPKDYVDLERLVAVQSGGLDAAYVRRWIVDMLGSDDARVGRWDEIVARYPAP